MAVLPALVRLHAIREAEEEQCRRALDVAAADLQRLHGMLASVRRRRENDRALIVSSVLNGATEDRLAALDETSMLDRLTRTLAKRLKDAEQRLLRAREQFLAKRIERRQVETLLETARFQAGIEQSRRDQSAMDEWFRMRSFDKAPLPGWRDLRPLRERRPRSEKTARNLMFL